MNERRPWWKLSRPAVVAGLVMLPTTVHKIVMPRVIMPSVTVQSQMFRQRGWPWICMDHVSEIDPRTGISGWFSTVSLKITSVAGLFANVMCAILLIGGPPHTINRWHHSGVIRCRVTVKGLLATTCGVAAYLAMARGELWPGQSWLVGFTWLVEYSANAVFFVGVWLTCFAVIDWIGGLCSVVTRRLARSTKDEPFDCFTEGANRVMQLAKQSAQQLNHEYVGTEHILAGLVINGGLVGKLFENVDVDLSKVQRQADTLVQAGPEMVTMGRLPRTPRARSVVESAIEEARSLEQKYIGPEHLLLGLLREQEGLATQVLLNLGVPLAELREEAVNLIARERNARRQRLTERARSVMRLAHRAAQRLNHDKVAPEHILLGLVEEGGGVAANEHFLLGVVEVGGGVAASVLVNLDVDLRNILDGIDKLVPSGSESVAIDHLPVSSSAQMVIEYAIEESRGLDHNYVGTEHLLMGLMCDSNEIPAKVLNQIGLTLDEIRSELLTLIGSGPEAFDGRTL